MITFEIMKAGELEECAALVKCEFKANVKLDSVFFITGKEDGRIVSVAQPAVRGTRLSGQGQGKQLHK